MTSRRGQAGPPNASKSSPTTLRGHALAHWNAPACNVVGNPGGWLGDVGHIGSTVIPGLAAKPILDLRVAVTDLAVADDVAAILSGQHWYYAPPELDQRPDRQFFVQVSDEHRIAHLHLLLVGGERWHQQSAFRGSLRSDANVAGAYGRLKAELAERYREDREAKGHLVDCVIRGSAR